VEEPDHRGEDLLARELVAGEVALDALAKPRQHLAELEHVAEFRAVARLAIRRVVAVLLAPARVAGRGLDVAIGIGTDPHVRSGGRDRELVEALALQRIADAHAVGREVRPAGPGALA